MRRVSLALMTVAAVIALGHGTDYVRMCYYTNWSQYRMSSGRYTASEVDPNLCTHIVYSFFGIVNYVNHPTLGNESHVDSTAANDLPVLMQLGALKSQNPDLKILMAVGGWALGGEPFSVMAADPSRRSSFITDVRNLVIQLQLDGLDIDWEYPTHRGGVPEDSANFVSLIQDVRTVFNMIGPMFQKSLMITAALPGGSSWMEGLDLPSLHPLLDYINVMTYDLHGQWDGYTGIHGALYPRSSETGDDRKLNQDWAIQTYLDGGVPKEKILMGIPTYGNSFRRIVTGLEATLGEAAYSSGANSGPMTMEAGFMSYYEICQATKLGGWTDHYDDEQKDSWANNWNYWVGYTGIEGVGHKAQYIKDNELAGAFVWTLDLDDFNDICGYGAYPLINRLKKVLSTSVPLDQMTEAPTTAPPAFDCLDPCATDGFKCDAFDNKTFFQCWMGIKYSPITCAGDLYYNHELGVCDWEDSVKLIGPCPCILPEGYTTTTTTTTTTVLTTTTTTEPPTTQEGDTPPPSTPPPTLDCPGNGYFPDPNNCHAYFLCNYQISFHFNCADGLWWFQNENVAYCGWDKPTDPARGCN